jgi:hypothetical protein
MRVASHRSEVLVTSRGVVGAPNHLDGPGGRLGELVDVRPVPGPADFDAIEATISA